MIALFVGSFIIANTFSMMTYVNLLRDTRRSDRIELPAGQVFLR